MRNQYDLDVGWQLQERLDFTGHNGTDPHINYELMDPSGSVQPELNGMISDFHNIPL